MRSRSWRQLCNGISANFAVAIAKRIWRNTLSKTLITFLAFSSIATAADAADLGARLPDTISFAGITLYGTIDLGGLYQTHGAPLSGSYPGGLDYNITGAKNLTKPLTTFGESGVEQSRIGISVEKGIGGGWLAIGRLEAVFNPLSGKLDDGLASLVQNNGKPLSQQASAGDSNRAGQAFSGPAYAGLSNASYGTLTFGRQQSLMLDALVNYDPQGLSYAFSLLGYSGFAGGAGDSEISRWDNSAKYVFQYGPAHVAAMYTEGGSGTGMFGGGYGFSAGGAYRGFSVDVIYEKEKGAVSSSSLTTAVCGTASSTLGVVCPDEVSGTISDNNALSIQGKYTFDFGGGIAGTKLTLFAGYEYIDLANPSTPVSSGSATAGGYILFSTNNTNYSTDRVQQVSWVGAKYEFASGWSFAAAFYHYDQAAFLTGIAGMSCATVTTANKANTSFVGNTVGSNCGGTLNDVSFAVDYRFNKYLDVYAGVNYSGVTGGLSSGFLSDNTTVVMSGFRVKF
jgi:predicted porin